jgi:anaerobic selenocysteine-containing dehydrogenase
MTQTVVRGACPHDCPDTCGWEVVVEDGRAVALRGAREHPWTRGGLCAKVSHYLERAQSPDRLLRPLRRTGPKGSGSFEPITWDEAVAEIAQRLGAIVAEHGGEAVLPYSYMGTQGVVQAGSMDRRFFHRLGASRLERTVCGATAAFGTVATNGTTMGIAPEDIVHSRFIVLWGTNTIVTNLHLWPAIREARARGARVVVVDPLRTRTAAAADWHVRPLPGTDAALALGMMHVILDEGLHDADYVERCTTGFDELRERAARWDPERAAAACGVAAQEIAELARAYARTRPSLIRRLIGMEHHAGGAQALRAVCCLPALTGAWRDRGGGMLGTTAWAAWSPLDGAALERPDLAAGDVRAINMIRLGRALTELDPPVRALVVYSSNPAAIAPDQRRVLRGLRRDDLFCVVLEQFLTDTARHADIVLPVTTQLEHLDLVPSWGHVHISLNRPAVAAPGEALPTSEAFRRLARAMGFDDGCFADSDEDIVRQALGSGHALLEGVTFERLAAEGWVRAALPDGFLPFAKGGFPTPSGRCELRSQACADAGLDPLPDYRAPAIDGDWPLALVTAKSALHFLNSQYANLPRHLRAEREPRIDLAAADAAARGIADGDVVRAFNDRGAVLARARVGDVVRPGVAALPSGWWPSLSPGGASANALTTDELADAGGGGAWHSTRVDVAVAA